MIIQIVKIIQMIKFSLNYSNFGYTTWAAGYILALVSRIADLSLADDKLDTIFTFGRYINEK